MSDLNTNGNNMGASNEMSQLMDLLVTIKAATTIINDGGVNDDL